jgi:8-hydroxy-5-deazaflavin:NADPH oxidoreductase
MSTISIIGSGGMAAAIGGLHHAENGCVGNRQDDDVTGRGGAARPCRRAGSDLLGQRARLGGGATHHLDGVSGLGGKHYGEGLAGKLLVDITNPIKSDFTGFLNPEDSFGAREIAKAAPADADVVKAFNTQSSHVLAAGPVEGHPLDVFLAGDDARAKARVSAFIESLGLRPMDAGEPPMARTLEHACMLTVGLLTHSVKHTNFSLGVSLLG